MKMKKKCNKDHKQQNRSNRRKNISGVSEIEDRDCEITQSENNNNQKSEIKPYVIYGRPWKHTHTHTSLKFQKANWERSQKAYLMNSGWELSTTGESLDPQINEIVHPIISSQNIFFPRHIMIELPKWKTKNVKGNKWKEDCNLQKNSHYTFLAEPLQAKRE